MNKWREALIAALLFAVIVEMGINVFEGRTLWQRVHALENRVTALESVINEHKK